MQLAIQHESVDARRPRLELVLATAQIVGTCQILTVDRARVASRYARHYRAAA